LDILRFEPPYEDLGALFILGSLESW